IKKSKIDVTIAKKDFLPSINVFGIMVFSTFVQNFGWDGVFAALTAGATQTLFDGGKRIFTLKKRKIEYETAVENYLKADLNALKEVNDALYTLKKDFEIFKNNEKRLNVADSNFIRVFKSYSEGTKSYIDYLDENTRYIRADKTFLDSKNQNFINLLSLYKAVGGAL
ncbi:MAG: TolC family protein, partial [bacterium]|nr:TolC family protein [bacterium]